MALSRRWFVSSQRENRGWQDDDLDGMTFALFGETSGNLRSGKGNAFDIQLPTEETECPFFLDHQHLHYEIERRPEQVFAKKLAAMESRIKQLRYG